MPRRTISSHPTHPIPSHPTMPSLLSALVQRLFRPLVTSPNPQARLNCLYVESLAGAKRWADAVAACDAAGRAVKPRSLLRPLLGWKAACLARLGRNVNAEMTKVKEHPLEAQVGLCVCKVHHI